MSQRSERFQGVSGCLIGLLFMWGEFVGIGMSFYRHGTTDGIVSILVPPWAWYRSFSFLWDTPKWVKEAGDSSGLLAVSILSLTKNDSNDDVLRARVLPELRHTFRALSHSDQSRYIELCDALISAAHTLQMQAVTAISTDGTISVDQASSMATRELAILDSDEGFRSTWREFFAAAKEVDGKSARSLLEDLGISERDAAWSSAEQRIKVANAAKNRVDQARDRMNRFKNDVFGIDTPVSSTQRGVPSDNSQKDSDATRTSQPAAARW
jgi:hypothetical protein